MRSVRHANAVKAGGVRHGRIVYRDGVSGAIGAGKHMPRRRKIGGIVDEVHQPGCGIPGYFLSAPDGRFDRDLKQADVHEHEVGINSVSVKQRQVIERREIILMEVQVGALGRGAKSTPWFKIIENIQDVGAANYMAEHDEVVICIGRIKESVVGEIEKPLRGSGVGVSAQLSHGDGSIKIAELPAYTKFVGDVWISRHGLD